MRALTECQAIKQSRLIEPEVGPLLQTSLQAVEQTNAAPPRGPAARPLTRELSRSARRRRTYQRTLNCGELPPG